MDHWSDPYVAILIFLLPAKGSLHVQCPWLLIRQVEPCKSADIHIGGCGYPWTMFSDHGSDAAILGTYSNARYYLLLFLWWPQVTGNSTAQPC